MAGATLALMAWGLGRPALWLDEAATVLATQRTWGDLWILLGGAEAPLVPYYALVKMTSLVAAPLALDPAASPEVLARWPSVAATVLAVWALTLWLARRGSPSLAVSAGVLLLATSSLSRYAQEARPYTLVLMLAVVATILWTKLVRDPRHRWVVLYALALAALITAHLLAGSLLLAHLLAAVASSDQGARWPAARRTAAAGALGVIVASPLAVNAAVRGQGPTRPGPLPGQVPPALVDTLTVGGVLALGLLAAGALALGVVWTAAPRYRSVAWVALAWAVGPLIALFPLMAVRPNLLMGRYLLFVLPGWAVLGGLVLVRVVALIDRALGRLVDPTEPTAASGRRLGKVVAGTVGVGMLTAVVIAQSDGLHALRTAGGHGDDIRPALAWSQQDQYGGLPIVLSPPKNSILLAAYARAEKDRLVGVHVERDQPSIWSRLDPYPSRKSELRAYERVVLILKVRDPAQCLTDASRPSLVRRCLPRFLDAYRVEVAEADGRGWIFAVLTRNP